MDAVVQGLTLLMNPFNIFLIFIAVLIGVVVGALPGLSSPMAIALLMPFSLSLEPIPAIAMMASLYCAGTFGGSITAILINAPGAPPAVATAFDGYPMAKRGEAGRALGLAAGPHPAQRPAKPRQRMPTQSFQAPSPSNPAKTASAFCRARTRPAQAYPAELWFF